MRPSPAGRPARALVPALAALALVACAPGDAPAATASPTATPTATPTPTPTPTPTGPVELGTRLAPTPPDSYLATADPAVLEKHIGFDPAGEHYVEAQFTSRFVSATVADPADLAAVELSTPVDPATETVYYVRTAHRLEWARAATPAGTNALAAPHVGGWDADGAGASTLLVLGVFDPCTTAQIDPVQPGTEVEACEILVLPTGRPLTWVGVSENPQLTRDAHEEYEAHPVAWRVP